VIGTGGGARAVMHALLSVEVMAKAIGIKRA